MKTIKLSTAKSRIRQNKPVYAVLPNGEAKRISYFTKDGYVNVFTISSYTTISIDSTERNFPVAYQSFLPVHHVKHFASSID